MKKILFVLFSFCAFSHAAGTYDGVYFTDSEETLSLFYVNYYPYQDLIDIKISSNDSGTIVSARPYTSLATVANLSGIDAPDMQRIREVSHLVNTPEAVNELGLTLPDHYFLMALMGSFVGFTFLFFLIYTTVRIARGFKG